MVEVRSYWIGWALNPMADVFRRKVEDTDGQADSHTQRQRKRRPCEGRDRACSDASTSQGMPRIPHNHQRLLGAMGRILHQPPE